MEKTKWDERGIRQIFQSWWDRLNGMASDGAGAQRGSLARLRRIQTVRGPHGMMPDVVAALMEPAFRQLCAQIAPIWSLNEYQDHRIEDLLAAAVTLAHVRTSVSGTSTAKLLGGQDADKRCMAEPRFERFMRCTTSADLMEQGRQMVALLGQQAPVGELGASFLLWRSQSWVRLNWARQYYQLDLQGGSQPTANEGA